MSKPRYWWWPAICRVVERYPSMRRRVEEMSTPTLVPQGNGMPHGSDVSQPTERIAMQIVESDEYRCVTAVEKAIEETMRMSTGRERMTVIRRVYWAKSHTLAGAAMLVPCHVDTARTWSAEFKYCVAKYMGFEKKRPL